MSEKTQVQQAHPGWRKLVNSDAFSDWIKSPEAEPYRVLCNSPMATDAIRVIDRFKAYLANEKQTTTRNRLAEMYEDLIFLEPSVFDEAILGVADRFGMPSVVAYDRSRVVDIYARDMPREEAEEFFEFNTIGAWFGELTPVFIDMRPAE